MEGTRHERVVMVLAAYVIGFTTAFIAFGITQIEDSVNFVYVPAPAQTASVVAATEAASPTVGEVEARLTNEGLVYAQNGAEVLVSAYGQDASMDGVHQSVFEFSLSLDKRFLYFCEVPTADVEACKPFVYVAALDTVYPVTEGGERIALPLTATELTWDASGLVAISGLKVDENPLR